ncbi:hypothetical protein PHYPSEUDO_010219 [Phytophthora pseudosyringae]|uniref:Flavodoxin-like domain-containing protein n=1 Tax=Phytophthora pseudosyringae TaxID=221518 RepID=A0A8T1VDL8_9STRA|nr:hypothetical protein PHYPSEUDO_010219 [Phytophthora pseudosyringae]
MTKIAIVFYSTFGHVTKLATAIKKGVQSVPGVQAELYQVKETLSEEVLTKLHAPPKSDEYARRELIGKPCGIFFSCGSRGGGQEVTATSTTPFIAHLGMLFALRGSILESSDEMHGCSLWGSGTATNSDRSRQSSTLELTVAEMQGKNFAEITEKLSA